MTAATRDPSCAALITALEDLSLPLAAFTHRAHVQAGFAYLQRHGFAGALISMARRSAASPPITARPRSITRPSPSRS